MSGRRRGMRARDEAMQRYENAGYSDAELDAALLRSQGSDVFSVGTRLVAIVVVFGLLARAIQDGLTAPYLILPLIAELLAMFWIGWLMSRTVVRCPVFRKSAGTLGVVLWTLVIALGMAAWLAYDPTAGDMALGRIAANAAAAWATIVANGLHWAVLVAVLGLCVSTVMEIQAWRQTGGVFVWTAITTTGTRIGLLILLGFVAMVPAMFVGPMVVSLLEAQGWLALLSQGQWAWPVWAVLLALDLGVLIVLTLMHRELVRSRRPAKAAG